MYDQLSFKIDELNQMVGTNGNKVTAPVSSLLFSLKEMIDLLSVQNSPRFKNERTRWRDGYYATVSC